MVCNILNSYLRKPPVFLRIPFVYGPIVGIHVTPSIAGSRRRLLRGKLRCARSWNSNSSSSVGLVIFATVQGSMVQSATYT